MQKTGYYYRNPEFRYPLNGHPDYLFDVAFSADRQYLIGIVDQGILTLEFTYDGLLASTDCQELSSCNGLNELQRTLSDRVRSIMPEISPGKRLEVLRFWLPEFGVGLEDLPEDLREYAVSPQHFKTDEHAERIDTLHAWKDEDLFALWWGQDFFMNQDGDVTSS